jgi:hypothetical protein
VSAVNDHPVAFAGAFLASPIGGGIASWVFAIENCTPLISGEVCTKELNATAGIGATLVGWALTAIAATLPSSSST